MGEGKGKKREEQLTGKGLRRSRGRGREAGLGGRALRGLVLQAPGGAEAGGNLRRCGCHWPGGFVFFFCLPDPPY